MSDDRTVTLAEVVDRLEEMVEKVPESAGQAFRILATLVRGTGIPEAEERTLGDLDDHPFVEPVMSMLRHGRERLARLREAGHDEGRVRHAEGWAEALSHAAGILKLTAMAQGRDLAARNTPEAT
jgi:hypothetical protein